MLATHPELELIPYLRGELPAHEREHVGRHLGQCPQCRESADSFAALLARLPSQLDELPTPEWTAYRAELRRVLAAREETRRRWWRGAALWASLATGAVAAALALSLVILRGGRSAPSMERFAMEQQIGTADVGLLQNYAVVERLDLLENYDVIEHLDELTPAAGNNESSS